MRKKIALFVSSFVLAGLLFVPTATADGTCAANSARPARVTGGVRYSGTISCSDKHIINVQADLRRRPGGGGSWEWVDSSFAGPALAWSLTAGRTATGYNCAKDYKVTTTGFAVDYGGGPNEGTHNLADGGGTKIFQNTC